MDGYGDWIDVSWGGGRKGGNVSGNRVIDDTEKVSKRRRRGIKGHQRDARNPVFLEEIGNDVA